MSKIFADDVLESELNLKTDGEFAKNYNKWRRKEELHKLETKYGNDTLDSSSSSSEDDEGEEVNEEFEKDFFKTLSCLKNKDPRIYDKSFEFFDAVQETTNKKLKKDQPIYIKDYERKLVLEKGGRLSDDEDNNEIERSSTYVEEQEKLKNNLKNVLEKVEDENEGSEWGGMFKTRQKTQEEQSKEEETYLKWLAGQKEHLKDENIEKDLKPLKDYWTNPELDEGEKFLRDYILNKKFLGSGDTDYIPTYEEVIHDSDQDLSEDEKALSTQEEFEHKYNFRFEEPDQDFIKRYPRTLESSLRQKDDTRKVKRAERKERKAVEKQQKMEEIQQLRALKKKEIEEKINRLKEITGNAVVGFDINDIEDDFDPVQHDKRMQALFNNEFYEGPEGEQKPEFPEIDQELELENWDYWHGNDENEGGGELSQTEPHCEDEDFNMDCDYDPVKHQKELIEDSKTKKKRKRKSKFAKVLSEPKPVFDPNQKTYQQYLDEYYKLDCEDIIGDIPCRFKYREVIPNSFGLSVEEILKAKDKELNKWCSIKKAIQHRPDHVEKYDVIAFEKKSKNVNLKMKCLPSLFVDDSPSTSTSNATDKNEEINKGKQTQIDHTNSKEELEKHKTPKEMVQNPSEISSKKRKRADVEPPNSELIKDSNKVVKKSQRSNRKKNNNNNGKSRRATKEDVGISDARLSAYGINPKKFKNKLKYGK